MQSYVIVICVFLLYCLTGARIVTRYKNKCIPSVAGILKKNKTKKNPHQHVFEFFFY